MKYQNNHTIIENNITEISRQYLVGIISGDLIGLHYLPLRLIGDEYRRYLQYQLPGFMMEIRLRRRYCMWYMQLLINFCIKLIKIDGLERKDHRYDFFMVTLKILGTQNHYRKHRRFKNQNHRVLLKKLYKTLNSYC